MLAVAARRSGVSGGECDEMADDVLHDAALRFMDPTVATPLAIRAYLLRSLRNRVANAARARLRRGQATATATETARDAEPYFEQAVVGCASEHAVRAAHGPGWDGAPTVAPTLARLANTLMAALSPSDRLLVVWLSHQVPHQEIAAWLGMSYDATSKRVRRLRARLQRTALSYADSLGPDARAEILAFLGRAMSRRLPSAPPARFSARRAPR